MSNPLFQADVCISESAMTKIQRLVFGNADKECGGLLIGTLSCDPVNGRWLGIVEDVYCIGRYGEAATFTFLSTDILDALDYIAKTYRQPIEDEAIERYRALNDKDISVPYFIDKKRIIGNFHSHGQFDAFFSSVDEKMMREQSTDEFYLVYSPSHKRLIGKFKDKAFNFYEANIHTFTTQEIDYRTNVLPYKTYVVKETWAAPRLNISRYVYEKEVDYSSEVNDNLKKRFNFSSADLAGKRILVVGAGTLGNEVAKNLAFSGISDITIVDMDNYEYHNLPRSPMISRIDVEASGLERNKAIALAKRIAEKSPFSIKIAAIPVDITKLGWGFFSEFDLIMSPVDSFAIRKYVDRGCKLYDKVHITAGTGVQQTVNGRMLGDVIVSPPDSQACYLCSESGNIAELEARLHCHALPPQVQPQVMGFSSTIAGVASSAALLQILGKFHEYKDGSCRDENGKHFYWKISGAEVGLFNRDYEKEVSNLHSIPVYRKRSCEYHSVIDNVGGKIEKITATRNAGKMLKQLKKLFGKDKERFNIDIREWGLIYYLAYSNEHIDMVRSAFPIYTHDSEETEVDYLQFLPKDHVYKVWTDNIDEFKLIRLTFEEEK